MTNNIRFVFNNCKIRILLFSYIVTFGASQATHIEISDILCLRERNLDDNSIINELNIMAATPMGYSRFQMGIEKNY
jgi:hypothetical protein